jgi:hypothetical protein
MISTVVRYQTKPERADENQKLIEAVFADLHERNPKGLPYKVFRIDERCDISPVAAKATIVGDYQ